MTREIGAEALARRRPLGALRAGDLLERLSDDLFAARLLASAGRLLKPSSLPEWDGSSLNGQTLVVVQRIRHVGAVIRLARLIAAAAQRADRCIVLAEPRLVTLFRRGFPRAEIYDDGSDSQRILAQGDVVASYETLTEYLASNDRSREDGFIPLVADQDAVRSFRRAYQIAGMPVIGVCWRSSNEKKDLPGLDAWAQFMNSINAKFISMQYGDTVSDIEQLRALGAPDVFVDESVESLRDFDRFAAQVASFDAVVTVSNTGAHMAGAVGMPMFVLSTTTTICRGP